MMEYFIGAAVACFMLTGWAALMDHRRGKRANLDRVGWVSWPLILVLSIVGAFIFVILAAKA